MVVLCASQNFNGLRNISSGNELRPHCDYPAVFKVC